MSIEIKVPALGESVTEATIARWLKNEGDAVKRDEPLVELETDKVNVEVPSPAAGVLEHIEVKAGGTVSVGTVLGAVQGRRGRTERCRASPQPQGRRQTCAATGESRRSTGCRRAAATAIGAAHRRREQSRRVADRGIGQARPGDQRAMRSRRSKR